MGGNSTLEEIGKNFPSLQFVVLHHQFHPGSERESHWDLLLEQPHDKSNQLLTFEVSTPPQKWGKPTSARRLHDHRSIYLEYEGPISGNRGAVSQVLKGDAQWVKQNENSLVLNLRFQWEKDKRSPIVLATLDLTKTKTENDLSWELSLHIS